MQENTSHFDIQTVIDEFEDELIDEFYSKMPIHIEAYIMNEGFSRTWSKGIYAVGYLSNGSVLWLMKVNAHHVNTYTSHALCFIEEAEWERELLKASEHGYDYPTPLNFLPADVIEINENGMRTRTGIFRN